MKTLLHVFVVTAFVLALSANLEGNPPLPHAGVPPSMALYCCAPDRADPSTPPPTPPAAEKLNLSGEWEFKIGDSVVKYAVKQTGDWVRLDDTDGMYSANGLLKGHVLHVILDFDPGDNTRIVGRFELIDGHLHGVIGWSDSVAWDKDGNMTGAVFDAKLQRVKSEDLP